MARLEIDNLTKKFGAASVLDGVTLSVARGETVAVYGHSGSGKSILLRILSGALSADAGDIRIDGNSVLHAPPEERDIGVAFQNFALYPHLTAFDNIASPLRGRQKLAREAITEKVRSVAKLLKIESVLSHYPQALSNGQRQRTALARALVGEPAVLLLDDPLRNVDAKLRYEMRMEMPELFRLFGAAVIYVTQDSREAMALASRIAVLHGGRFVQVGAPQDVYEYPCTAEVARLLGDPAVNLFAGTLREESRGWGVAAADFFFALGARYASLKNNAGQNYLIGVRPEDIVINDETASADAAGIAATIESITPANIRALIVLKSAADNSIVASCGEDEMHKYRPGMRVRLAFAAESVLLFADDERLIAPCAAAE